MVQKSVAGSCHMWLFLIVFKVLNLELTHLAMLVAVVDMADRI